jgi:hypothetical protein
MPCDLEQNRSEQQLQYMAFYPQRHTAIKRTISLTSPRRRGSFELKGQIIKKIKLKGKKPRVSETERVCSIARTQNNIVLKSKFGRLYINKLVKMNRFLIDC